MNSRERAELDRHITGNWGDDSVVDDEDWEVTAQHFESELNRVSEISIQQARENAKQRARIAMLEAALSSINHIARIARAREDLEGFYTIADRACAALGIEAEAV